MAKRFSEQVCWVTGATSGIGYATAMHFAKEGARVGVLGRSEKSVQRAVDEINSAASGAGGEALPLCADVRDAEAMQRACDAIVDRCGRLDNVVINAGVNGIWAPIEELKTEEWDETIEINLRGSYLALKYAVPHLKKRGGAVVLVSSVNGTRMFSNTGASAYASSKAAQVALAKMVALELAENRVRVNVICPGAIETSIDTNERNVDEVREPVEFPEGMIPLTDGKPGSADQVADLIGFLCSPSASHITGTEVFIDGGQSLLQG